MEEPKTLNKILITVTSILKNVKVRLKNSNNVGKILTKFYPFLNFSYKMKVYLNTCKIL